MRRYHEEAWNAGHVDWVDKFYTSDCMTGTMKARDMRGVILSMRETVPDFKLTILDMIAEGDKVALQRRMSGTSTRPMEGAPVGPPPGKPFAFEGVSIYAFENGQVIAGFGVSNMTDKLIETGVAQLSKREPI